MGLNRAARARYRRMAADNPEMAARLRRLLWPVLRLGNRALLGKDYVPLSAPRRGADGRLLDRLAWQQPRAEEPFTPRVTVIVPNYNHAPYLAQRLDSIYAQDYPAFDVILMDDCSTDDSRTILPTTPPATPTARRFCSTTRTPAAPSSSGKRASRPHRATSSGSRKAMTGPTPVSSPRSSPSSATKP